MLPALLIGGFIGVGIGRHTAPPHPLAACDVSEWRIGIHQPGAVPIRVHNDGSLSAEDGHNSSLSTCMTTLTAHLSSTRMVPAGRRLQARGTAAAGAPAAPPPPLPDPAASILGVTDRLSEAQAAKPRFHECIQRCAV